MGKKLRGILVLPDEIPCSGSFPWDELLKEELACKMRQQKCWGGGGNTVSEADTQIYNIDTN